MATILKLSFFSAVSVLAFFHSLELVEAANTSPYFPAIFALGDTILDIGNNNKLKTPFRVNFFPYGIDYSPNSGVYSNGRGFMNFFAKFCRLTPIRRHADLTSSNFKLFNRGVNFASSSSGLLASTYCSGGKFCTPFPTQVSQFLNVSKKYSKKTIAKSLYLVTAGSNDFFYYFEKNLTIPLNEFISSLVTEFSDGIQKLYAAGARKIIYFEVPALGCTPLSLLKSNASTSNPSCNSDLNSLTATHNFYINQAISSLTDAFEDLYIVNVKLHDFLLRLTSNPASFGFKDVTSACCGKGKFNAEIFCGFKGATYCKNRNDYLWWDYQLPTQKAYGLLAEKVFNGDLSVVSPYGAKCLADSNCM